MRTKLPIIEKSTPYPRTTNVNGFSCYKKDGKWFNEKHEELIEIDLTEILEEDND